MNSIMVLHVYYQPKLHGNSSSTLGPHNLTVNELICGSDVMLVHYPLFLITSTKDKTSTPFILFIFLSLSFELTIVCPHCFYSLTLLLSFIKQGILEVIQEWMLVHATSRTV